MKLSEANISMNASILKDLTPIAREMIDALKNASDLQGKVDAIEEAAAEGYSILVSIENLIKTKLKKAVQAGGGQPIALDKIWRDMRREDRS